jgi:RNA polymerase sigma-70 factor (ECF subfamily)
MNRDEFGALYDRHVGLVRSVLFRVCPGARGRLDDLTQEVFLRAWRSQSVFRRQAAHKTWLVRIARNLAIDELRASGSRPEHEEMADVADAPGLEPHDRITLRGLIAGLPADDRILIVLLCVEQWTTAEISRALEIPAGTVKSRAFALRQRLRAALSEQEREHVA